MSNKEHNQTILIAELINEVSAKSDMSLQDAMDFVYNSEVLEKCIAVDSVNIEDFKHKIINELHNTIQLDELNHPSFVAEDIPEHGIK